jgi:hypothetical protein
MSKRFFKALAIVIATSVFLFSCKAGTPALHIPTLNLAQERITSDYVVYILRTTQPVFYAGMHMQIHNKPSLLWTQRREHINEPRLPSHVKWIDDPLIGSVINSTGQNVGTTLKAGNGALEREIDSILSQNPNATFTLLICEMDLFLVSYYFLSKGVSLNRLKIEVVPDGARTLLLFNEAHGASGSAADQEFSVRRATLSTLISRSTANPADLYAWDDTYKFAASVELKARYWLNHAIDVFPSNNVLKEINWVDAILVNTYRSLNSTQQRNFSELMHFYKADFDAVLYPAGERRIPIIIAGTHIDGQRVSDNFESEMRKVVATFGSGYRYFFKGHPRLPNGNTAEQAIMQELGFEPSLPNMNFPLEFILLAYPDITMGGYASTTYLSASDKQFIFHIGDLTLTPLVQLRENGRWPLLQIIKG